MTSVQGLDLDALISQPGSTKRLAQDWLRTARLALLLLAACLAGAVALAATSVLGYLLVTRALTPPKNKFTYDLPLELVGNDLVAHVSILDPHHTAQGRFLDPGQKVDVWVEFLLPYDSEKGIAHVTGELASDDGHILAKTSRPVLLRGYWWSPW